jgi:hypothetical protein
MAIGEEEMSFGDKNNRLIKERLNKLRGIK